MQNSDTIGSNQESIQFKDFGFKESLAKAIQNENFVDPTPIQMQTIPHIMDGKDVVGQAQTGTGKTAAFGLPMINKIKNQGGVECLIIAPTRELAIQVTKELKKFGQKEVHTITVYGGQSYTTQIKSIKKENPHIVVSTPGRLLDLLKQGIFKNLNPHTVVLDEADEMLNMGFLEDVEKIFSYIPEDRQTLLFSATMPKKIQKLASTILKDPIFVNTTDGQKSSVNKNIEEYCVLLRSRERSDGLIRIIDHEEIEKAIVFCKTKTDVDQINALLLSHRYSSGCLHGDIDQRNREKVMEQFKANKFSILIATDVASRGLDVKNVSHVFNYHIPFDSESYVHRVGRTGRAGESGKAISLVTPDEYYKLSRMRERIQGDPLSLYFVPSSKSLEKKAVQKSLAKIEEIKPRKASSKYLEELLEKHSLEEITLKLISYVLNQNFVLGPEHIGLSPKEAEEVVQNKRKERSGPRKRSSRFSNRRGGSRQSDRGDRGSDRRERGDRDSSRGSFRSKSRGSRDGKFYKKENDKG